MLSEKADGKMAKAGLTRKPLKEKKCKQCKEMFTPFNSMQKACGVTCANNFAKQTRERQEQKAEREAKRKHTAEKNIFRHNLGWYLRKTQEDCNAFIRERDRFEPCISCGTTADVQYCAGHYRPQGKNAALRFSPLNIHKQCNRTCNMAKSGNLTAYRPRLIEKIGLDMVEWLENFNEPKRWTIDELKELRISFKQLLKDAKIKNGSD